jgi:hypothetical protein
VCLSQIAVIFGRVGGEAPAGPGNTGAHNSLYQVSITIQLWRKSKLLFLSNSHFQTKLLSRQLYAIRQQLKKNYDICPVIVPYFIFIFCQSNFYSVLLLYFMFNNKINQLHLNRFRQSLNPHIFIFNVYVIYDTDFHNHHFFVWISSINCRELWILFFWYIFSLQSLMSMTVFRSCIIFMHLWLHQNDVVPCGSGTAFSSGSVIL